MALTSKMEEAQWKVGHLSLVCSLDCIRAILQSERDVSNARCQDTSWVNLHRLVVGLHVHNVYLVFIKKREDLWNWWLYAAAQDVHVSQHR